MEVTVDLAHDLDAEVWRQRHARGEVPDGAPYGLDRLAVHGVRPVFRPPLRSPFARWTACRVRNHVHGAELVAALASGWERERRARDAVLCMDERTGLAAALVPGGPPVLSGVAWIHRAEELDRPYRTLVRRALPRAAGVWTNVAAMQPELRREWGLPDGRVHVLPLGIDTDFFPEQPWPDRPSLVASAGEDRMRDHALLVAAVDRCRTEVPAVHLELATTIPVEVDPELVTVHRRRLDGEMRGLYRRSTVVAVALHPTMLGSGLTVVLEAMASGRAVVVTDNPGIDDYVRHGETGLLVPPADPDAFAAALRSLLLDPERAREMGRRGREAVLRSWTTTHMAAALADLLRATA